jgi:hypothetical protein
MSRLCILVVIVCETGVFDWVNSQKSLEGLQHGVRLVWVSVPFCFYFRQKDFQMRAKHWQVELSATDSMPFFIIFSLFFVFFSFIIINLIMISFFGAWKCSRRKTG